MRTIGGEREGGDGKGNGHSGFVLSPCSLGKDQLGNDHLASGSDDQTVRVWDVATGDEKVQLEGYPAAEVNAICALGNEQLASGSNNELVRVWDASELDMNWIG